MVETVGRIVRLETVDVCHVAAEKTVFTDGDAVGLAFLEAEKQPDGLGLLGGLDVMDTVDDQRPFRVFLEKGALVVLLSRSFGFKRRLIDIRRGRVERVDESGVTVADGAVSDSVDGLSHQQPRGEDAPGFNNKSQ